MGGIFQESAPVFCCQCRLQVVGSSANEAFGSWFAGFVDGEGCFVIRKYSDGKHRPAFQLNLREDDIGVLLRIHSSLELGRIYPERAGRGRDGYWSKPKAKWFVQNLAGCRRLVDVFDTFPLRSKKLRDYLVWRQAVIECCSPQPDQARLASLKATLESGRRYTKPTIQAFYGNVGSEE